MAKQMEVKVPTRRTNKVSVEEDSKQESAAIAMIEDSIDRPPQLEIFSENGITYKYFKDKKTKEWVKKRVGKNGLPIGRRQSDNTKEQISFSIDSDTKAALLAYCNDTDHPMSMEIADILKQALMDKGYLKKKGV